MERYPPRLSWCGGILYVYYSSETYTVVETIQLAVRIYSLYWILRVKAILLIQWFNQMTLIPPIGPFSVLPQLYTAAYRADFYKGFLNDL